MKIQVNTCIRYVGIAKNNKIEKKIFLKFHEIKLIFYHTKTNPFKSDFYLSHYVNEGEHDFFRLRYIESKGRVLCIVCV